ncbi:MAG: hypothetical protein PHR91_02095 [Candidatus Omnitrophica bacterium]|nr:hypothetical protein [Candidatus Omnitrophota bacterium]
MTECEFWEFLEKLQKKGMAQQYTGVVECGGFPAPSYISGHALLPKDYDKMSVADIVGMGSLLFNKQAGRRSKEAAMILLAHQPCETALTILARYCIAPDKGLEIFAELALDECAMWNE